MLIVQVSSVYARHAKYLVAKEVEVAKGYRSVQAKPNEEIETCTHRVAIEKKGIFALRLIGYHERNEGW